MRDFKSISLKSLVACQRDGEAVTAATKYRGRAGVLKPACASHGKLALPVSALEATTCCAAQRTQRPRCEEA